MFSNRRQGAECLLTKFLAAKVPGAFLLMPQGPVPGEVSEVLESPLPLWAFSHTALVLAIFLVPACHLLLVPGLGTLFRGLLRSWHLEHGGGKNISMVKCTDGSME